jgi:hypothetical protein
VEAWIGSAVIAVVISSIVTMAGWYATHRGERLMESARRQERIQDIQTALLADIRSTGHRFRQIDLDSHLAYIVTQIESAPAGRDYTPFVPGEPGSLLWSSVAHEVHILPNDVIEPVVIFFSQLETVRYFVEDLRSERFLILARERKAAMYEDYVRMMRYLVQLADDTEIALARSLHITPALNNPDAGPSSLSGASAPGGKATAEDQKSA